MDLGEELVPRNEVNLWICQLVVSSGNGVLLFVFVLVMSLRRVSTCVALAYLGSSTPLFVLAGCSGVV